MCWKAFVVLPLISTLLVNKTYCTAVRNKNVNEGFSLETDSGMAILFYNSNLRKS